VADSRFTIQAIVTRAITKHQTLTASPCSSLPFFPSLQKPGARKDTFTMSNTTTSTTTTPPRTHALQMRRNAIMSSSTMDTSTNSMGLSEQQVVGQHASSDSEASTTTADSDTEHDPYDTLQALFSSETSDAPVILEPAQLGDGTPTTTLFKHIGRGTCGVVFAQPESAFVWKQALPGHEKALEYEQALQWETYQVFERVRTQFAGTQAHGTNNEYIISSYLSSRQHVRLYAVGKATSTKTAR